MADVLNAGALTGADELRRGCSGSRWVDDIGDDHHAQQYAKQRHQPLLRGQSQQCGNHAPLDTVMRRR